MHLLPASITGLTERVQDTYRRTRYSQKPIPKMHALIIGIDHYACDSISELSGAVTDTNLMERFLRNELSVPADQIKVLRNQEATRAAIIAGFDALRENSSIRPLDPILIYYAGHGSEMEMPGASVLKGSTPKTQCLVPQDVGTSDAAGNIICPIPDYTISTLLYDLAEAKGNNITVILDCCHSASGTRGVVSGSRTPSPWASLLSLASTCPPSPTIEAGSPDLKNARYTDPSKLPALPDQLDDEILTRATPGLPQASVLRETLGSRKSFQRGMRSHVLLAACGHSEKAFERSSGRGGYFTAHLLAQLRRKKIDKLTYKDCMTNFPRLNTRRKQTPICEGEHVNRFFFNASEPGAHYSFIPVVFDGQNYVLQAGAAQGVTNHSQFGLYEANFKGSDNPRFGTCRVATGTGERWVSTCRLGEMEQDHLNKLYPTEGLPKPNHSLLQVPTAQGTHRPIARGTIDSLGPGKPPVVAYAQLIESRPWHTLDIYFTDAFRKAFGDDTDQFVDVKRKVQVKREMEREGEANTVLGLDAQTAKVTFTLRGEEDSDEPSYVLPHTVPADSKQVETVLFSMLQWRWHSLRNPPDETRPLSEHLRIELYKLKEDAYDGSLLPDGENLNIGGEAAIFPSSKVFYGFKVINESPRLLFAYPFYFSTANQSIRPLFLRVHGGDGADAPMEQYSDMTMGYGDDDHSPVSFQPTNTTEISEGVLDIGIVRFFITTEHTDFESVAQASPFAALGWVARGEDEFSDGLYFARQEQAGATLGGENVKARVSPLTPQNCGLLARDSEMNWNPKVHHWDVVEMKVIIRRDP